MAKNKSYFGGAIEGIKSLLTGMDITMGEYITPKVTEQYPENRKTQHIAERHRGTLIMPHDENGKNKCTACTLCEKICPNGSIKITSAMVTTADGKKKKLLLDYQYDLGDCMFCQLCVNACNFGAITFVKDFENSVFDRNSLIQHLNNAPTEEEMKQYDENAKMASPAPTLPKGEGAPAAKKVENDVKSVEESSSQPVTSSLGGGQEKALKEA